MKEKIQELSLIKKTKVSNKYSKHLCCIVKYIFLNLLTLSPMFN